MPALIQVVAAAGRHLSPLMTPSRDVPASDSAGPLPTDQIWPPHGGGGAGLDEGSREWGQTGGRREATLPMQMTRAARIRQLHGATDAS